MSSSRHDPPSRPYKRSHYDSRNEYRDRERDNGWAGRRERGNDSANRDKKRLRSRSRSRDHSESYDSERTKRKDDYSRRKRDSRERSYRDSRNNSRSPSRKRRRSRSPKEESTSRHRGHEGEDRRRPTQDRAREDEPERGALVRRNRSRSRSRSRSMDSEERKAEERRKPNFGNSGLLAAATNTVQRGDGSTTVLKYNEPPEARKPVEHWRLYEFKEDDNTAVLAIHRQSVYTFGRDAAVVDIPLDHPSCSKQHAALQYRQVVEKNEFGEKKSVVKPFVIDLESTNGTHVNDETIPPARYYELKLNDVIKFGTSTREFVLLHEGATD